MNLPETKNTFDQPGEITALPPAGRYEVTQYVQLLYPSSGAQIHYTTDGSTPTQNSPLFNPFTGIPLKSNEGEKGLKLEYSIHAAVFKDGIQACSEKVFSYTIHRRNREAFVVNQIYPDIWMIKDYDDDKMFFILGSKRGLLIDTGMGNGNLRKIVDDLRAGLPLDVIITHGHPDHIACIGQFQNDCQVFMNHADLPLLKRFIDAMHYDINLEKIENLNEGFTFDLGTRILQVIEMPGHSPGCITLLDEAHGILFAGDAVGSNRWAKADSLWMQMPNMAPVDVYLNSLQEFRQKVAGKIKEIYTGHNDQPLLGEAYLDHLQQAAQNLVEHGVDVLIPSLRPPDAWLAVSGDPLTDPNWAGINVNKTTCLSNPPKKAGTIAP